MTENILLQPFNPIRADIEKMKAHNAALSFDYETNEGNKAARSHIFVLRKVKTRIADAHKIAKADALEVCKILDGYKRDLTSEVDGMIELHDAPLREIEERERRKAEAEAARIQAEKEAEEKRIREEIEAKQRELQERERAIREKEEASARAEREAQIVREAEARAKAEAERKITEERERAEREKAEAIARIERENREREQARIREEKRIADEAKAKAEAERIAEEKRQANKAHRAKINTAAKACLVGIGVNESLAVEIINAIATGKIENVSINY
jgi:DNA repair exonuclease SbcCD ATPase subunit